MLIRVKHLAMLFCLLSAAISQAQTLPPCPDSPNCVSSEAEVDARRVAPLIAGGDAQAARENLIAVLTDLSRVQWQAEGDSIIRAQFTSALFRFVDDVQFVILDDGRVHVRSASRVGYWDLGANRRRVEQLREALANMQP